MTTTLYIKGFYVEVAGLSERYAYLNYQAPAYYQAPTVGGSSILIHLGPSATDPNLGAPTYASGTVALEALKTTHCPTLLSQVNASAGYTAYDVYEFEEIDQAVLLALHALLIPTLLSQLTNDTGFITSSALAGLATITALAAKQNTITPGAHLSDVTSGLPTSMNVLTTLLGSLTGDVNNTNTVVNALTASHNTLKAELQTQGLLLTS